MEATLTQSLYPIPFSVQKGDSIDVSGDCMIAFMDLNDIGDGRFNYIQTRNMKLTYLVEDIIPVMVSLKLIEGNKDSANVKSNKVYLTKVQKKVNTTIDKVETKAIGKTNATNSMGIWIAIIVIVFIVIFMQKGKKGK